MCKNKNLHLFLLCAILAISLSAFAFGCKQVSNNGDNTTDFCYQLDNNGTYGTCFALTPNYFITCAHTLRYSSDTLFAKNNDQTLRLDIVAIDTKKDLALLKSSIRVSKYANLVSTTPYNLDCLYAYGYQHDGKLQKEKLTLLSNNQRLISQSKDVGILRLSGEIVTGYSGAPILDSANNFVGIISCKNQITDEIYAINMSEINRFLEENNI